PPDGTRTASAPRHIRGPYQQGNWRPARRYGWRGQGDTATVVSKDGGANTQPTGQNRAGRLARAAPVILPNGLDHQRGFWGFTLGHFQSRISGMSSPWRFT